MLKSMYSGVSGLGSHQAKMDTIGNNIANVNTYGFKSGRVTFAESLYQTSRGSSGGNDFAGGTNASQVGYGAKVGTIDLMFSSGTFVPTTSATDCMIDGNGFFAVGPKTMLSETGEILVPPTVGAGDALEKKALEDIVAKLDLTRVGNFAVDTNGYLVDGAGNVAYGYTETTVDDVTTTTFGPIKLPFKEDAEGEVIKPETPIDITGITIDQAGKITGINDKDEAIGIGTIAIVTIPNPNGLTKTQGPYYKAGGNSGAGYPYEPGGGTSGSIIGFGLESSNVDLSREFSDMITTQRGFQACSKIITVADEMLQELVNLKR